jgi:hypothetical protein
MPEQMNAERRVNKPMTSSTPNTSSITPAAPLIVNGDAFAMRSI